MLLSLEAVEKFGVSFSDYLETVADDHKSRWIKKFNQVNFNPAQINVLQKPSNTINIVVISAEWCGDCSASVPILGKMAEICQKINLKVLKRKDVLDILEEYAVDEKLKIPVVIFLNENFKEVSRWIEKSNYFWELIYEAKLEAVGKSDEDYREIKKNKFKGQSERLMQENINEIFHQFKKAFLLINQKNLPISAIPIEA